MHTNRWSSIALTTLACATVAHAQSQTTGAIRGTVKSKQGGALADATLTLRNLESGLTRTCKTDSKGAYHLGFLPVGSYELSVTALGMKTMKNSNLQVTLGEASIQNFSLDAAEATTVVEVVGQTSSVDSTQINTATAITSDLVESVPLRERNFTDLVQLTPGASAGGATNYRTTVEGARGISNNLQIDGASYNNKFNAEQRGGTRVPFSFGADSIRELQVITNAFDAQYGDASGAIVNAVTKSGTNDVQGMAMILARPSSLIASVKPVPYDPNGTTNAPSALKRDFSQQQFAFNIGGPIVKDKVHYFVNAESMNWRQWNMPTISLGSGNGTENAFNSFWGFNPLQDPALSMSHTLITHPAGRSISDESKRGWYNELKNLTLFGRLDWAIDTNNRLAIRINSQNYTGENDTWNRSVKNNEAESNNSHLEIKTLSTVLELTSILSPALVNEGRIQFSNEDRPKTPNSTISSAIGVPGFYSGQYSNDPSNTIEKTTQIMDNMSWMSGDWQIKGGFDWQIIDLQNNYLQNQNGSWSFNYDGAVAWWNKDLATPPPAGTTRTIAYSQGVSKLGGRVAFTENLFAGYLQAQYSGLLNKRLILSFGGRYTKEAWEDNPLPNPLMQSLDHMPDCSSLDPRFGFTYDMFGDSKTVFRGGYGYFSVSNPAQNAATVITNNGQNTLPYKFTFANNPTMFSGTAPLSPDSRLMGGRSLKPMTQAELATYASGTLQVMLIDPKAKMAQSRVLTIGLEQDLGDGLVFGVKLTTKRFSNLQYWTDINLGQYGPSGTVDSSVFYNDGYTYSIDKWSTARRPGRARVRGRMLALNNFGSVYLSKYDGEGKYRGLVLEANRRSEHGFGFRSSLTLQKAEDTNSNERSSATDSAGIPMNPANPLAMTRSDNDIPVRFLFTGYLPRMRGFKVSGTVTWSSGYPYTPKYRDDVNTDGVENDPVYALGGRNAYSQPKRKTFDMRFSRNFKVSRKFRFEGILDIYNVFNWANQTTGQTTYAQNPTSSPFTSFQQISVNDDRTREIQFTLKARF